MIKLVNLLKENEEEGGITGVKSQYDITLGSKSGNLSPILAALDNTENYGIYLSNLINTDPRIKELVAKEFSPSGGPNMKIAKATEMWNKGTPKFRNDKQQILKDRLRKKGVEFEDNDWSQLSFKSLPKEARNMNTFFIEKSKPAMDEFIKSVAKSIGILNYEESEGELIFPTKSNPKKDVTKKIIKTVMDNADISDYQIGQREVGTGGEDGGKIKDKPTKPTTETATLTTTLSDEIDAKDLEKKLKKQFNIPNAKYSITKKEDEDGLDSYKLVITGITPAQRANMQAVTTAFTQDLMESHNRMLKMAGILTEDKIHINNFISGLKNFNNELKDVMNKNGYDV